MLTRRMFSSIAVLAFPARKLWGFATPTFGTVTAAVASPNSATVSVAITGGVSMQVQASTDGFSTHIDSPWLPVASSVVIGQLQPSTTYSIRVLACDAAVLAFASPSGNVGISGTATVTTNAPITSWQVGLSLGSTTSYNATQYPLNGRWMDEDTGYWAWMANGTIVFQHNDGGGEQYILETGGSYTGGRSVFFSTVDSAFTTFTLLNPLGTGDGANGWGKRRTGPGSTNPHNLPAGWTDNSSLKASSLIAKGNILYHIAYHQEATSPAYNQQYGFVNRSDDGGATWYGVGQTSGQASANGNPPIQTNTMWSGTKLAIPRWVKQGGQGAVVTNPTHGIDAYQYVQFRDNGSTQIYLGRIHENLDKQVVGNYEYYIGSAGGDVDLPANWSTSATSPTSILALNGGSYPSYEDIEIQYLADFGRFVMVCEVNLSASLTDGSMRLAMFDSSSLTSFTLRYSEPTKPPFNATQGVWLNRAWNSIFMPTYSRLTTNPPSASIQIVCNGTSEQSLYPNAASDPTNDMYSPWIASATLFAVSASSVSGKTMVSGPMVIR